MTFMRWLRSIVNPEAEFVANVNQQFAAMEAAAERFGQICPICTGTDVFLCPDCKQPIKTHSHENDWLCDCTPVGHEDELSPVRRGDLRFVTPIRQSDGARISGNGEVGPLRVLSEQ